MKMNISKKKIVFLEECQVIFYTTPNIVYGYCFNLCSSKNLKGYFKKEIIELKQVHSNIIFNSDRIKPGIEGDGIILTEPDKIAVIRTADCVPLFFYSSVNSVAGIIHAGWRGFYSGIEKKLTEKLLSLNIDLSKMKFVAGPHIEGKCYEVGNDLYEKFSGNPDRDKFFVRKGAKLFLDIFRGLKLSLIKKGVPQSNISNINLCTFCSPQNLPSYRKNNTEQRIRNFIFFR